MSTSDPALAAFISWDSKIVKAQGCLEWIFRRHGSAKLWANHSNRFSARVFLSAYLIHFQHNKVFSVMGVNERLVIRSARKVLASFDEVVGTIKEARSFSKVPTELVGRFRADLSQFFNDFAVWHKEGKTSSFYPAARSGLVSLYMSYFASNGASHASLETAIQELRAKMVSVCGPAALALFDGELRDGKFGMPSICDRPLGDLYLDPSFFVLRNHVQTELVNRLLLDQNFQYTFENKKESPIFVHVSLARDRGAHWNEIMFELLSSPPKFNIVHQTLLEFKAKIQFFVRDSRAAWIAEVLEFNNISTFGWSECVDALYAVAGVFRKIQMPVRDLDAGWSVVLGGIETPEVMVDALKFLHKCSMNMEMDFSNLSILTVSRRYHYDGVNHMSKKFDELLDSGAITMERTEVGDCFL